jgi:hypothetical protein
VSYWSYNKPRKTWRGGVPADFEESDEPIVYRLSPRAEMQWRESLEWANRHGSCELALHGVGDPATRTVMYFACGEQEVSSASCETSPEGIAKIALQAANDELCVLCQVHHHPFAARRADDEWDPDARFGLSGVDYDLIEQLATDLLSEVLESHNSYVRMPVTLRVSDDTELRMNGNRFSIMDEGSAEVTFSNVELQSSRSVGDVFVAVTASDGLPHGKALRTEICDWCGKAVRKTLHPLELKLDGTDLPDVYQADAFDADRWWETLDDVIERYWIVSANNYEPQQAAAGGTWGYTKPAKTKARRRKKNNNWQSKQAVNRLRRCIRDVERGQFEDQPEIVSELHELSEELAELTLAESGSESDDSQS